MFPLKPFLDRVIVEVIPIEHYYEQPESIKIDLDKTFSQISDRGVVKAVGPLVQELIQVGDVVQFDPDTAYAGQIYLNPADKSRKDRPKLLEIRLGDQMRQVMQVTEQVSEMKVTEESTASFVFETGDQLLSAMSDLA